MCLFCAIVSFVYTAFEGSSLNAMRLIYKHNVIHILYKRIWFISGLCSLFIQWPADSAVIVLSCEVNGQASSPAWNIINVFFSFTFHFQLIIAFSWVD